MRKLSAARVWNIRRAGMLAPTREECLKHELDVYPELLAALDRWHAADIEKVAADKNLLAMALEENWIDTHREEDGDLNR